MEKRSQKKIAQLFIGICSALILGITTIISLINMNKSEATSGDIIDGITLTMLPANPTVYEFTTQTVETLNLKPGCIYFFEAWGGKGGNGGNITGGKGGKGSYAYGLYDMRASTMLTASIFAGGSGSHGIDYVNGAVSGGGSGWAPTQLNIQLIGTPGGDTVVGASGGGGGSSSGIYVGATALLVAGGGGGGGGGSNFNGGAGGGLNGVNGAGGANTGGKGATQFAHGIGGSQMGSLPVYSGTDTGGGGSISGLTYGGGGAGGGWTRGFAGGGGGLQPTGSNFNFYNGSGGGGSGGTSYIGGVQSLIDSEAGTEWAVNDGNGKVRITEYLMGYGTSVPTNHTDYTVSDPSKTLALPGESYTFTITREIGVGHVGLQLNSTNGVLELTSTNGNVFTYTVSNVQGQITANDFSVTTYNVNAPPVGTGYAVSLPSLTNVLIGGSYTFVIELDIEYALPMVTLNSANGKVNYSSFNYDANTMTVIISNVVGNISADDFIVSVSRII